MKQKRLRKYGRDENTLAAVSSRQITPTSVKIIATIHDYRIIGTSLLLRLVEGNKKNLYRQLQHLYHMQLINRFAFMRGKNPGEFHYYLDNVEALRLLVANGAPADDLEFDEVRRNKEKRYCDVNDPSRAEDMQGKLLFLKHEIMISRFHAMLDLACSGSQGRIELTEFQQGAALYNKVEVPKLVYTASGEWKETGETEYIPHRPDAFFTLSFPEEPKREPLHFFYEADRQRTNANKYNKKLRGHFHFAVHQKERLRESYDIRRIRAVVTETIDDEWADYLRFAANSFVVSGPKPSELFWFSTSRLFTQPMDGPGSLATHLGQPDIIFQPIWATPVDNRLRSLIEVV